MCPRLFKHVFGATLPSIDRVTGYPDSGSGSGSLQVIRNRNCRHCAVTASLNKLRIEGKEVYSLSYAFILRLLAAGSNVMTPQSRLSIITVSMTCSTEASFILKEVAFQMKCRKVPGTCLDRTNRLITCLIP